MGAKEVLKDLGKGIVNAVTPDKGENGDLYVSIVAVDQDYNWPNYIELKKGEKIRINKTLLDRLIEDKGNFNIAVEKGSIVIGE